MDDSKAHDDLEVMWTQTESLSPVRAGSSEKCRRLQTIPHLQLTTLLISHPLMLNITQIDLLIHAKHLITIQMI